MLFSNHPSSVSTINVHWTIHLKKAVCFAALLLLIAVTATGQELLPGEYYYDKDIFINTDTLPAGTTLIDRWGHPWNPEEPDNPPPASTYCDTSSCGIIICFEDIQLGTDQGFDDTTTFLNHSVLGDTTVGGVRRWTALKTMDTVCHAIDIDTARPDILIRQSEFDGHGALAYATPFFPADPL